jgi:hypothetical protein
MTTMEPSDRPLQTSLMELPRSADRPSGENAGKGWSSTRSSWS